MLGAYHDEIVLHYMGESPLAGTHAGKDAVLPVLGQASYRAARKLIGVEVRRVLLYRVEDGRLRECWLYDEDQRFVDALWSRDPDA